MKAEDIAKLRAEKPREFDALVAVTLHDWSKSPRGMCNPLGGLQDAPAYSTDRNADGATLAIVSVRHVFQRARWADMLAELVQTRLGQPASGWWPAHVEPGDYSHAALLAFSAPAGEPQYPKTLDGAPITPGMTVHRLLPGGTVVSSVVVGFEKQHPDEPWWIDCRNWNSPACDLFSTKEAAALAVLGVHRRRSPASGLQAGVRPGEVGRG